MSKPETVFDAFTDLETTLLDMRAMAGLLMLTAEYKSRETDATSFLGRQLDDWERKMHAAYETLHEEHRLDKKALELLRSSLMRGTEQQGAS